MFDKAQRSLEVARMLADQGHFDFSASRIYYAMFYTAEALLLHRGLSFSSHSAVIASYGKEFSKTGTLDPKFHKYLIAAQDYRSQGDYSYGPSVPQEDVQNAIRWAGEFIEAARNYLGDV
jgi:uncharacterized protein (UPF0332 family)